MAILSNIGRVIYTLDEDMSGTRTVISYEMRP